MVAKAKFTKAAGANSASLSAIASLTRLWEEKAQYPPPWLWFCSGSPQSGESTCLEPRDQAELGGNWVTPFSGVRLPQGMFGSLQRHALLKKSGLEAKTFFSESIQKSMCIRLFVVVDVPWFVSDVWCVEEEVTRCRDHWVKMLNMI